MSYNEYFTRLGNAVLGRTEAFDSPATGTVAAAPPSEVHVNGGAVGSAFLVGIGAFLWFLVMIVFFFFAIFAGARLSWCYNTAIGTSDGLKIVYVLLAFFFSGFYIPYYAFFLNPLCGQKKNSSLIRIGGFRL